MLSHEHTLSCTMMLLMVSLPYHLTSVSTSGCRFFGPRDIYRPDLFRLVAFGNALVLPPPLGFVQLSELESASVSCMLNMERSVRRLGVCGRWVRGECRLAWRSRLCRWRSPYARDANARMRLCARIVFCTFWWLAPSLSYSLGAHTCAHVCFFTIRWHRETLSSPQ